MANTIFAHVYNCHTSFANYLRVSEDSIGRLRKIQMLKELDCKIAKLKKNNNNNKKKKTKKKTV